MDVMSNEEMQQILSVCLDEIVSLKEENDKLKQQVSELAQGIQKMLAAYNGQNKKMDDQHELCLHLINSSADNSFYEIADERKKVYPIPKIHDISYTINEIIDKHKSMARFGDGEFTIMLGACRQKFQKYDSALQKRLVDVLHSKNDNLLIGIADNYGTLDLYTDRSKQEIRSYMSPEIRMYHNMLLEQSRTYHNAYISRPYAMYADNGTDAPRKRFDTLKRIWDKRDVIIIEGQLTRLGVGNDLFDNANTIVRIEAPAVNAFTGYDLIIEAAREEVTKYSDKDNVLFIIALGPTACLLAYDLCNDGYQALDVGHVDLEYEWFMRGLGHRCVVNNKYNNECVGGDQVEDVDDEVYLQQIVQVIEVKSNMDE